MTAIASDIYWPAGLPCALREGHTTQHGTPFVRTQLASGRSRQRRKFSSVPSVSQFSWLFTEAQCAAFEAWFRDAISDGASWFNMETRTPLGRIGVVCRFEGMYTGPDLVGRDRWKVSAPLEYWERPLMPPGWGLMPEYLLGADIFDIAMNDRWPKAQP
jgi:hypothetical protein